MFKIVQNKTPGVTPLGKGGRRRDDETKGLFLGSCTLVVMGVNLVDEIFHLCCPDFGG